MDDNILAARALERWFGAADGLLYAGWSGEADAAVAMASRAEPDVVLLDLEMPGVDTLGLIPRLLQAAPRARVVMLSGHVRPDDIGRSLDAGASGYITKDEPTAIIAALVRRAAAGECVLSPLAQKSYFGRV